MRRLLVASILSVALAVPAGPAFAADTPVPGDAAYLKRDNQNQAAGWGRNIAQLTDPAYLSAALAQLGPVTFATWLEQAKRLNRPSLTLQTLLPPTALGNPLRKDWAGRRGQTAEVAFTNRYGALLRGTVFAPLPGAKDPYTGAALKGPFPSVVITPGSVQGLRTMYTWLAQDLAERGYVVMTFDVQGQGQSETFPHLGDLVDLPSCDQAATPLPGESGGCPGVPFQQPSNFVFGSVDAIDFFQSTPDRPYPNPARGSAKVDAANPFWKLVDASPDPDSATPGRTGRLALIGHSLGAAAAASVQGTDQRVSTIVALDKLQSGKGGLPVTPVVPALGLQAEFGALPVPYTSFCPGFSFSTCPGGDPAKAPNPQRERGTGFDAWKAAGVDSAVFVTGASSHFDYTDLPLILPASRYGQQLSSAYTQAWLAKYLKHDPAADALLTGSRFAYREPGRGNLTTLDRDKLLSFYFCSAYHFRTDDDFLPAGNGVADSPDVTNAGC
ncbi:MAG: hypothetical protein ABIS86_00050 [Streptosporangiaceae bacterium]